jgi:hypothetical protein
MVKIPKNSRLSGLNPPESEAFKKAFVGYPPNVKVKILKTEGASVEDLIDELIDGLIQLSQRKDELSKELNPIYAEPSYLEETYSNDPDSEIQNVESVSVLTSGKVVKFHEAIRIAKYFYDKLPDGTVNLKHIYYKKLQIREDQLEKLGLYATEVASQLVRIKESIHQGSLMVNPSLMEDLPNPYWQEGKSYQEKSNKGYHRRQVRSQRNKKPSQSVRNKGTKTNTRRGNHDGKQRRKTSSNPASKNFKEIKDGEKTPKGSK